MSTLYQWAGGATAFERFINAFYDRVEHDDLFSLALQNSQPGAVGAVAPRAPDLETRAGGH